MDKERRISELYDWYSYLDWNYFLNESFFKYWSKWNEIHVFVTYFFSNPSSDKLLIESALDNTEKIVANILANANQGKRQVVLKER